MADGRRVAHKHSSSRASAAPLLRLVALLGGALLTGVAWVFLVRAAIDFGVVAVHGRPEAWPFTIGAGLGAVVCMVLVLALVGRALRTFGYMSDYKPRRAAARRRR